jgi:hypothetical protein
MENASTLPIAMSAKHISFESPFPSEPSVDGKDRLSEFL